MNEVLLDRHGDVAVITLNRPDHGRGVAMPRARKPASPFRCFNSSPEVIRLVVLMYEGVNLVVHFTKKQGAPVHYVGGDDPAASAAVREVDLRKKFYLQRNELATKVGLSPPKAKVLRAHLGIDDDPKCCHVFEFGAQKIPCFSDNGKRRMEEALPNIDMAELWANRNG